MRMFGLIVVWLSMSAGFAHAQAEDDDHRLKGLTKIRLLVEDLNKGSELCGDNPRCVVSYKFFKIADFGYGRREILHSGHNASITSAV